ncbi:MAG: tRNA (adenosine(37)-N6)-threonylcarbamoyltransferase complex ATPase subunit type 1 TsaE [Epsilonproteobacteria bacterium]|nr:tRNA (adenosine(37)-N6)-threonylcarbamoyltransferase complex ATPase subunit type 1 TsaE [Campylobacterota bacterium]
MSINEVIECIKTSGKNIILLKGTLGSGKTTLVKEFAKSINPDITVTSPTFSLQNIYNDTIYHYDLYNKEIEQFISMGMLEELQKDGMHFIEWPKELQKYLDLYGFEYLTVEITMKNNKRIFNCIH